MQNISIPRPLPFIKNRLVKGEPITIENILDILSNYAAEVFIETRNMTLLEIISNINKYAYIENNQIHFNMQEVDKLNNKR